MIYYFSLLKLANVGAIHKAKSNVIMRFILLILLAVFSSCNPANTISENLHDEFEESAQSFQLKYVGGSENCTDILTSIDENLEMSEIAFSEPVKEFTYQDLEQYCPFLPKKEIIVSYTEQKLLNSKLGYDFVSQLYLRESLGDTVRETTTRIWELKQGNWKIVLMNNSLSKARD